MVSKITAQIALKTKWQKAVATNNTTLGFKSWVKKKATKRPITYFYDSNCSFYRVIMKDEDNKTTTDFKNVVRFVFEQEETPGKWKRCCSLYSVGDPSNPPFFDLILDLLQQAEHHGLLR